MITNLIDISRFNWKSREHVLLSLALGLVVGLIFGWIFGASGSPSTGYNAIDSGSDHFVYQYSTENQTYLDIVPRPPLEGSTHHAG